MHVLPRQLQVSWHVPVVLVLQAVYHMPTSEVDEPASSMPLALQTLFYRVRQHGFRVQGCKNHLLYMYVLLLVLDRPVSMACYLQSSCSSRMLVLYRQASRSTE